MIHIQKWMVCLLLMFLSSGFVYGQPRQVHHGLPCGECDRMVRSVRLSGRKADAYYKIIHTYAKKIEIEVRKGGKDRRKAEQRINRYRTDRDRKIRSLLSPQQFKLYMRFVKERPLRIHDKGQWLRSRPDYRY